MLDKVYDMIMDASIRPVLDFVNGLLGTSFEV